MEDVGGALDRVKRLVEEERASLQAKEATDTEILRCGSQGRARRKILSEDRRRRRREHRALRRQERGDPSIESVAAETKETSRQKRVKRRRAARDSRVANRVR